MSTIHPTAIIDPSAQIGQNVEIGPYVVIERDTVIGDGCVIRAHSVIGRHTRMGKNNFVDVSVSLGGLPQDLKFPHDMVTYTTIGDKNTFREFVTVNRASKEGTSTIVGNNTYWMTTSHAGHDCIIHDNVIMTAGTKAAGHCEVFDGVIMPANGALHQFIWVGRKAMFQGGTHVSMHVPPYVICVEINKVVSLNIVGLRRDPAFTKEDVAQIHEAFNLTYRSQLTPAAALAKMDKCTDWGPAANEFREFVRKVINAKPPYAKGLCPRISRLEGRKR